MQEPSSSDSAPRQRGTSLEAFGCNGLQSDAAGWAGGSDAVPRLPKAGGAGAAVRSSVGNHSLRASMFDQTGA